MIAPLQPLEIFLQPGEYYFGDRDTRIRTVLGSCVSMTLWHPMLLVGGMCHYMLPERGIERRGGAWPPPDGRYADEAIALLLQEIDAVGVSHKEYQVKLFGGGNMFPGTHKSMGPHIGLKNVEAARRLVEKHGFSCIAEHLGDVGHRNIIFNIWNGDVLMKHLKVSSAERAIKDKERRQA